MRWSWVNFQCRGVLLVWIRVGQGPTAFSVGADGGCLDIFTLIYLSSFSLSLGDDPIKTEILSQRVVKPKNNQPTKSFPLGGGAMVLGKLPVPGRPTILITVGQGPTTLSVGAGGGCLDVFTLLCLFSPLSLSLGDGPI